ncbi:hypothetical protein BKA69DRAFT_1126775 [Paraphysoderma sedebokerense]|nr:hypothetical protein BKA69DRAFT_1126775 [Paraphysoderma sedebokerense]
MKASDQKVNHDAYYKANLSQPPVKAQLPLDKLIDTLARSNAVLQTFSFQFAHVDKPEHGTIIYFVMLSGQEEPACDGFFWLDSENLTKHQIDANRTLHIYERSKGVAPGDRFVSMTKKRYQLVVNGNPLQLQMVHYLASDESTRLIQVNPANFKTPARRQELPAQSHFNPPAHQPQPNPQIGMAAQLAQSYHRFSTVPPQMTAPPPRAATSSKRKRNQAKTPPAPQRPAIPREPMADDLIHITARDISLARYRRNHEYMEEIFSPFSKTPISPRRSDSEAVSQELQERLANLQKEVSSLQKGHSSKLKEFKAKMTSYKQFMNEINTRTDLQDLTNIQSRFCQTFNVVIEPYRGVKIIELDVPADIAAGSNDDLAMGVDPTKSNQVTSPTKPTQVAPPSSSATLSTSAQNKMASSNPQSASLNSSSSIATSQVLSQTSQNPSSVSQSVLKSPTSPPAHIPQHPIHPVTSTLSLLQPVNPTLSQSQLNLARLSPTKTSSQSLTVKEIGKATAFPAPTPTQTPSSPASHQNPNPPPSSVMPPRVGAFPSVVTPFPMQSESALDLVNLDTPSLQESTISGDGGLNKSNESLDSQFGSFEEGNEETEDMMALDQ